MKCMLLAFMVLLGAMNTRAQGTFSNTGSGLNDIGRYMDDDSTSDDGVADDEDGQETAGRTALADILQEVTMDATDSLISFSQLPEKAGVTMHITDAAGEELLTRPVSARRPEVSAARLPKSLLFVTLTYKKYRKAFELNRDEGGQRKK